MVCPKCNAPMDQVTYADVIVDRCIACRGIWFDAREHVQLALLKGSEALDDGNAYIGQKFNKIDRIQCPDCRTPMIRMVDVDQPHIWYESCKVCCGVFFDATEFRDYKDHTLVDWVKDRLLKKQRT